MQGNPTFKAGTPHSLTSRQVGHKLLAMPTSFTAFRPRSFHTLSPADALPSELLLSQAVRHLITHAPAQRRECATAGGEASQTRRARTRHQHAAIQPAQIYVLLLAVGRSRFSFDSSPRLDERGDSNSLGEKANSWSSEAASSGTISMSCAMAGPRVLLVICKPTLGVPPRGN